MAGNNDEFDRGGPMPGGIGEASRRAVDDIRSGQQARASDEDVERARERLRDASLDGAGDIGAANDGRSTRAPEGDNELAGKRGIPSSHDEGEQRRKLEAAHRNEQDRLTRE